MALCVGAVPGPIAGLAVAPFAFLGAACALMSIVLACVSVHESAALRARNAEDRSAVMMLDSAPAARTVMIHRA